MLYHIACGGEIFRTLFASKEVIMVNFGNLALNVNAPKKMPIENPSTGTSIRDKEGKESFLMLMSNDSAVAMARKRQSRKRLFDQVQKGKKINYSVEQAEEDDIELLVALTKDWYLVDPETGDAIDFPFNEENARTLYSSPDMVWLRDQAEAFVSERANFTKA